jgi:hypothetical protein
LGHDSLASRTCRRFDSVDGFLRNSGKLMGAISRSEFQNVFFYFGFIDQVIHGVVFYLVFVLLREALNAAKHWSSALGSITVRNFRISGERMITETASFNCFVISSGVFMVWFYLVFV